jgi:hypothetical protein
MSYEIPQYWPSAISTNSKTSCWTTSTFMNSPKLEVSKSKDKYILKINSLEIQLSEKELIDWIMKFEMSMAQEV